MNLIELTDSFNTDEAAREYLESLRWPNGAACPHRSSVKADETSVGGKARA
jgi:hypothetical protein